MLLKLNSTTLAYPEACPIPYFKYHQGGTNATWSFLFDSVPIL